MPFRLVGHAERRMEAVLLDSARRFGLPAAERYAALIWAAVDAVANAPDRLGARDVPGLAGVRSFPLRLARPHLPAEQRVRDPRHLLVYRVAPDGVVEILSLVHDRMVLSREARRAQRETEI